MINTDFNYIYVFIESGLIYLNHFINFINEQSSFSKVIVSGIVMSFIILVVFFYLKYEIRKELNRF